MSKTNTTEELREIIRKDVKFMLPKKNTFITANEFPEMLSQSIMGLWDSYFRLEKQALLDEVEKRVIGKPLSEAMTALATMKGEIS